MNIIEAFEANKTQKVKNPSGGVYDIGVMVNCVGSLWRHENVFGEWTVVRELKEIWVNEYPASAYGYDTKERALEMAPIGTLRKAVHYREVIG